MLEYSDFTISNSIKLIGLEFSNKIVQEEIKNNSVKIIEDKKTNKPKYIIRRGNNIKEYFPEDICSIILGYLKNEGEIYINKEINKATISVPIYFNNDQINEIKNASINAGFKEIKIIYKPIAAAYTYINKINPYKNLKVLIFDLDRKSLNVSIVNNEDNNYYIFSCLNGDNFGDEDFNQRLIDYVIEIIKKDNRFKDIDFNNKKKVIKDFKRIIKKVKEVQNDLLFQYKSSFFLDNLYGIDDFEIEIKRIEYEELCIDSFNKCLKKVDDTIKEAKLKKEEIDEIILVGKGTRIPKIKEMIEKYFNKRVLNNINPEEGVVFGTVLIGDKNLNIQTNIQNEIKIEGISPDDIDISF